MRRPALARAGAALLLVLAIAGCGSGKMKEDPLLALSAEEALSEGKRLMEAGKYRQAQEYLTHAFEVEPNSPGGREALLLAADAFYLAGGEENYIRAEAKYRDFQNRFPTTDKGDYVLFQIASSLAERTLRPDRDQTVTHKALEAFRDVITLYPTSDYAAQAKEQVRALEDTLAESEYLVGHFYHRVGMARAAVSRLESLLDTYPAYAERDKALYYLGLNYRKLKRIEDARKTFQRLREEFPDSPLLKEVPRLAEPQPKTETETEPESETPTETDEEPGAP